MLSAGCCGLHRCDSGCYHRGAHDPWIGQAAHPGRHAERPSADNARSWHLAWRGGPRAARRAAAARSGERPARRTPFHSDCALTKAGKCPICTLRCFSDITLGCQHPCGGFSLSAPDARDLYLPLERLPYSQGSRGARYALQVSEEERVRLRKLRRLQDAAEWSTGSSQAWRAKED